MIFTPDFVLNYLQILFAVGDRNYPKLKFSAGNNLRHFIIDIVFFTNWGADVDYVLRELTGNKGE
jgi:hypothetical protein